MKLAEQLGVSPKEIVFSKNGFGKPYVASPQPSPSGEGECRTHFNLSYRSDFALLAIADREVGIDIEQVRTIFDVDAFCSSYFHHNEKAIIDQALPSEQADTIFIFWAFKEAFIKCLGIGFSRDLTEFDLSPFYHSPTKHNKCGMAKHLQLSVLKSLMAMWVPWLIKINSTYLSGA